jgi:hypothetical protein
MAKNEELVSSKDQFSTYVESERTKTEELQPPAELTEPPKSVKDITILVTAFQNASEYYKDLVRDAESPAMRWYAKGACEAYGFVAARIREILNPTVRVKPELAESAIEATYQANISVMRAMDTEKNGNGKS